MSEEKKLLAALSNSAILEFIDVKKLANSQALINAAEFAAVHAIEHGDRTYIEKILEIFKGTNFRYRIIEWFCFRCGFECRQDEKRPVFFKSPSPPSPHVQLSNFMNAKPRKKKAASKPAAAKAPVKGAKKPHKKIDMLDSWARLPGSFGSGRRG